MGVADTARQSAVEVLKSSLRQSKDGIVLSLVIHPADVQSQLLTDPIGQRYMMALVPIGEDEKPVAVIPVTQQKQRVAQDTLRSERSKTAYRGQSPQEQAVTRAAMLCADPAFHRWIEENGHGSNKGNSWRVPHAAAAADWMHWKFDIKSRRDLAFDEGARSLFLDVEYQFNQWAGRTATP